MKILRSIPELIKAMESNVSGNSGVLEIMSHLKIPKVEFEKYYTWNPDRYTRNILTRKENFEIILICWEKGQSSPIHDFNAQEAWIHPIEGRLREERFIRNLEKGRLDKVSNMILGKSEFSYMNKIGIHRYSNDYNGRSVSLNIYQKPVDEWLVYFSQESTYSNRVKTWENNNYGL